MELSGTKLPFHSFSSCDWLSVSADECVENKTHDREIKNQFLIVFHRRFFIVSA